MPQWNFSMPDLQLSFHGTFALKKEDLAKILQAAIKEKGLKDSREGLMDETKLGNEKVLRIKSWAVRSGLATKTSLTPEGQLVLERDPYLKSLITDWLMHFYLSFGGKGLQPTPSDPAEWGGWSWFIYRFLPNYFSFTVENLIYEARSFFSDETDARLEKNFRYVLRAYTEEQALASCQVLQAMGGESSKGKEKYIAGEAILPNPYLIGYFLAKLWERDYGQTTSIVTDDILHHSMGLTQVLGLEPATLQAQIDKLEIFGLLEQRRTVPPFQIIRRWDNPLTLLEEAYAHT
jgi:hypothetical protein